jgi:hypothetical protein
MATGYCPIGEVRCPRHATSGVGCGINQMQTGKRNIQPTGVKHFTGEPAALLDAFDAPKIE